MPDISKINALAIGSVSKVDGLAKASILDIDGVAVPGGFTTGLFDTYTGAEAGYSVRRLYSLYTGDCMQVRRASDGATAEIGFDSNGELDTTAIATFCGASDGFVAKWYDQASAGGSLSGKYLEQFTASEQPKIYDGTTGIIENGTTTLRPALEWEATASTGDQLFTTGFGTGDTRYFSYVAQATTTTGGGGAAYHNYLIFTAQHSGSSPGNFFQVYSSNSTNSLIVNFPTNALDMSSTTATNVQHLFTFQKTSTDDEFWINGTSQDTATGTQSLEDELSVGWFFVAFARMKFQELVIWNTDQDGAGNRTGIETDIDTYFDI